MVINFLQKIINLVPRSVWGMFPSQKREEERKRQREGDLARINYSLSQIGMNADDVTYVSTEKRPLDMLNVMLSILMSKNALQGRGGAILIGGDDAHGFSTVIYTRGKKENEANLLSFDTPLTLGGQVWPTYQEQDSISRTAGALELKKLFQVVHDDGGAKGFPIGINPDAFAVSSKSKPLKIGAKGSARATTTLFNLYSPAQLTVWGAPEEIQVALGHAQTFDTRPPLREPKIIS